MDWPQLRQTVQFLFPGMSNADIYDLLCRHCGGTTVACNGREIVGYYQIEPRDNGLAWLNYLGVLPPWRGQGTGASLLRRCEGHSRSLGFTAMALDVFENNPHAIEFYERNGYIQLIGPVHSRSQGKLRLGKSLGQKLARELDMPAQNLPASAGMPAQNMPSIAPATSFTLLLRKVIYRALLRLPTS